MQIRAKNVSFWLKIYNSKTTEQIGLKFNGNAFRDVWTKICYAYHDSMSDMELRCKNVNFGQKLISQKVLSE